MSNMFLVINKHVYLFYLPIRDQRRDIKRVNKENNKLF